MSKTSDLSQVIEEIKSCSNQLINAINALTEIFSSPDDDNEGTQTQSNETSTVNTYEFTDVRKAFSAKSHEGFTAQVKALITKYGANKLSEISKENYPALMADLEAIK